jgi:hypothetical protein
MVNGLGTGLGLIGAAAVILVGNRQIPGTTVTDFEIARPATSSGTLALKFPVGAADLTQ